MSRKYTAQEIRTAVQRSICEDNIAEMLLQYADELEREKKYEYEYACFGRVFQTLNGARVYAIANEFQGRRPIIARRECGKWEEVSNED